jgi:hypothetical protein
LTNCVRLSARRCGRSTRTRVCISRGAGWTCTSTSPLRMRKILPST